MYRDYILRSGPFAHEVIGNMRRFVRWVFSLNAVYSVGIGALAFLAPAFTIALYGGAASDAASLYLHALFRVIGAYMIFSGAISALVAYDPEASPLLLLAQGALSVLTLSCWGIALAAGDVEWSQVSVDVLVQLPILAAVALYYPRARQYVEDKLMILMDGSWKRPPQAIARPPADAELPVGRVPEGTPAKKIGV
jgi:hypothetical protein